MYTNPSAPQLLERFQKLISSFKDPSTPICFWRDKRVSLTALREVGRCALNIFSFMGSQGDAGQFRTPRHIIDFIVEIVNPQKWNHPWPSMWHSRFLNFVLQTHSLSNTDKKLGDNSMRRPQTGWWQSCWVWHFTRHDTHIVGEYVSTSICSPQPWIWHPVIWG